MSRRFRSTRSVCVVHLAQCVGVARHRRVAGPWLHVVPPAVVGAAEAHEVRLSRVVARQAHRLHHRLGARHVEGHRVQAGDGLQPRDVAGHHRVVAAEHRPQRLHPHAAFGDAGLVDVHAEEVDAVGAAQVVEDIAIQVGERDALRRLQEAAHLEVPAQQLGVLEGHAVAAGELQVGQAVAHLVTQGQCPRITLGVVQRQTLQRRAALRHHGRRRAVAGEEALLVVAVAGQPRRDAARHARMAGQRRVLGPRQFQALACRRKQGRGRSQCQRGIDEGVVHRET